MHRRAVLLLLLAPGISPLGTAQAQPASPALAAREREANAWWDRQRQREAAERSRDQPRERRRELTRWQVQRWEEQRWRGTGWRSYPW